MIEEDIPDIVETLRECAEDSRKVEGDYYADQFATDASVFDDAADAIEKLRDEIIRLRLTDAEREAVEQAIDAANAKDQQPRTKEAATMSDTNERPVASTGSVADEPAAWGVLRVGGGWVSILANEVQAETSRKSWDARENWVHEAVPLYRARLSLTKDEQWSLAQAILAEPWAIETLRGLLSRTGSNSRQTDDNASESGDQA